MQGLIVLPYSALTFSQMIRPLTNCEFFYHKKTSSRKTDAGKPVLSFYSLQKNILKGRIGLKHTAGGDGNGLCALLFHSPHGHSHMLGFDHDRYSFGLQYPAYGLHDLPGQVFLDLQPPCIGLHASGKLA